MSFCTFWRARRGPAVRRCSTEGSFKEMKKGRVRGKLSDEGEREKKDMRKGSINKL